MLQVGPNPVAPPPGAEEAILNRIDAEAKRILNREVCSEQRTEVHFLEQYETDCYLKGFPIDDKTSIVVRTSERRKTLSAQTALGTDDFDVVSENGLLILENQKATSSPFHVEVTYTGGMALDFDAFLAAFPDIVRAVEDQFVHDWNKRKSPGRSINLRQGSVQVDPEMTWLKTSHRTLSAYRRPQS